MKGQVVYFDCSAGAAGDMFLGALIDAGAPENMLHKVVDRLGVKAGVFVSEVLKNGERGKRVEIKAGDGRTRVLSDIESILENSSLDSSIIQQSKQSFRKLAEVEAKVHGTSSEDVHFHEAGGIDSIIDIVGTFALVEYFSPSRVYASEVNLGRGGTIECSHGKIPNPAPATLELLKNVPIFSTIEGKETVTPTGAVLLVQLVEEFGVFPSMRVREVGGGAGKKDFPIPNILRAIIGEEKTGSGGKPREGNLIKLEANIDDCSPEILGHAMEELFEAGAIDVFHVPVHMKKNRPGVQLVILCDTSKIFEVERVLFEETSTLGYRYIEAGKRELPREIEEVHTKYGKVKVKLGRYEGNVTISPEYDDCRQIAKKESTSLRKVYQEAIKEILSRRKGT